MYHLYVWRQFFFLIFFSFSFCSEKVSVRVYFCALIFDRIFTTKSNKVYYFIWLLYKFFVVLVLILLSFRSMYVDIFIHSYIWRLNCTLKWKKEIVLHSQVQFFHDKNFAFISNSKIAKASIQSWRLPKSILKNHPFSHCLCWREKKIITRIIDADPLLPPMLLLISHWG